MATVQEIIRALSGENGELMGEGARDLAQKLRKYAYTQIELEFIYKQVLQSRKQKEEMKKALKK